MLMNRERELNALESHFQGLRFKIVVIEGRSGVGKTALIDEFVEGKQAIRLTDASAVSRINNLDVARAQIEGEYAVTGDSMDSWEDVFAFLAHQIDDRRMTVIIDDYPETVRSNAGFEQAFRASLEALSLTSLFVILSGTHQGFASVSEIRGAAPYISTHLSTLKLPLLGFAATGLLPSDTPFAKRIERYALSGSFPGNYPAPDRKGDKEAGRVVGIKTGKARFAGLSSSEKGASPKHRVLHALAAAKWPCVGQSNSAVAQACELTEKEALAALKDLKKLGIVSRNKIRIFENGKFGDHYLYRIDECSDLAALRYGGRPGVSNDAASDAVLDVADDVSHPNETLPGFDLYCESIVMDIAKGWLWEACRSGEIPFEINDVVYWEYLDRQGKEALGLLAVNDHFRKVVVCMFCKSEEKVVSDDIIDFIDKGSKLPFNKHHFVVFTTEDALIDAGKVGDRKDLSFVNLAQAYGVMPC